ncbi:branched-chain amino acid ABC transporter permease [Chelatococcus reniformis]|uniref:Branched-chain amino acid ABC transporter permease n=1 Tax=Chelatococcus reniformis TaxID=1494448 RepID=A0A916TWA6_9HYPH|nr:branched-chain amino acid ABC transporter permease [Chelatococcus reniformis]GGC46092.1 branched-chain amino acid ABC transporter permease [Chelatococcus reniformis]
MSTQLLLFQVLNGLGIGMIYFLLSVGLTLIFGLMRFVNFAHGAFYLAAAYIAYAISLAFGSIWWALLIGPLAIAALALVIERLLLRHTYAMPHEAQILITFAVALLFQEIVILIFDPLAKSVPVPASLSGIVFLGPYVYPAYRLAVVAAAAVIAVVLWLVVERTKFGAMLRAGSENAEMVGLLGINVDRVFMAAFALGGALAGLAGVLAAPLRGAEPFMSTEALGIAFVVVVVGGLGTLTGALVGGLLIGLVQSIMSTLWPEAAQLMIYAAMALVLLVRPAGLFGRF